MIDDLSPRVENKRCLILGVGDRKRGDDGVGCFLIKRLQGKLKVPLIDGGLFPEKHLGDIVAYRPDFVLVVAAANVPGASSGEIALFDVNELASAQVTVRGVDVSSFFKFIPKATRPTAMLLAVQPDGSENRKGVSDAVRVALDGLESLCVELFGE